MNTTKYTPGPWEMETVRTACGICHKIGPFPGSAGRETGHACIYVDYPGSGPKETELEANAHLIAAAPDLLAACDDGLAFVKHALEFFGWGQFPSLQEAVEQLRDKMAAAIAKAKGNP